MIYSAIAPGMALPPTWPKPVSRPVSGLTFSLWSCGKAEFGQIPRSFSLHAAIIIKRSKNLTQIGFPSLRSVKPDRLLGFQEMDNFLFRIHAIGITKINQLTAIG